MPLHLRKTKDVMSGHWGDQDYVVLDDKGRTIGTIYRATSNNRWFWTVNCEQISNVVNDSGYEASRDIAREKLATAWRTWLKAMNLDDGYAPKNRQALSPEELRRLKLPG